MHTEISLPYLLLFAVSVVGLTQIILDADMPILVFLRDLGKKWLYKIPGGRWGKVLECYQCCGTWCGFFCGFFLLSHNPIVVLLSGCAGSYLAQWGTLYLEYLQAQTLGSLTDSTGPGGLPPIGTLVPPTPVNESES